LEEADQRCYYCNVVVVDVVVDAGVDVVYWYHWYLMLKRVALDQK
jgi:hypothetical protein